MNILLLSFISTIVFGIIDALFFILFEETLQTKIYKLKIFNLKMSELITGMLSTASAIYVATSVRIPIEEQVTLIKHPLMDASGIIIGSFIVIFTYMIYINTFRKTLFSNLKGAKSSS